MFYFYFVKSRKANDQEQVRDCVGRLRCCNANITKKIEAIAKSPNLNRQREP